MTNFRREAINSLMQFMDWVKGARMKGARIKKKAKEAARLSKEADDVRNATNATEVLVITALAAEEPVKVAEATKDAVTDPVTRGCVGSGVDEAFQNLRIGAAATLRAGLPSSNSDRLTKEGVAAENKEADDAREVKKDVEGEVEALAVDVRSLHIVDDAEPASQDDDEEEEEDGGVQNTIAELTKLVADSEAAERGPLPHRVSTNRPLPYERSVEALRPSPPPWQGGQGDSDTSDSVSRQLLAELPDQLTVLDPDEVAGILSPHEQDLLLAELANLTSLQSDENAVVAQRSQPAFNFDENGVVAQPSQPAFNFDGNGVVAQRSQPAFNFDENGVVVQPSQPGYPTPPWSPPSPPPDPEQWEHHQWMRGRFSDKPPLSDRDWKDLGWDDEKEAPYFTTLLREAAETNCPNYQKIYEFARHHLNSHLALLYETDPEKKTPLYYAARLRGHEEVAGFVVECLVLADKQCRSMDGGSQYRLANERFERGDNIFHCLARWHNPEQNYVFMAARLLMFPDLEPLLNKPNDDGWIPRDLCPREQGHQDMRKMLGGPIVQHLMHA